MQRLEAGATAATIQDRRRSRQAAGDPRRAVDGGQRRWHRRPGAHRGYDVSGKTGSSQVISNAGRPPPARPPRTCATTAGSSSSRRATTRRSPASCSSIGILAATPPRDPSHPRDVFAKLEGSQRRRCRDFKLNYSDPYAWRQPGCGWRTDRVERRPITSTGAGHRHLARGARLTQQHHRRSDAHVAHGYHPSHAIRWLGAMVFARSTTALHRQVAPITSGCARC